jgi:hypothetical protein
MPFGPEMEPVHAVIQQTVEEHGVNRELAAVRSTS